MYVICNSFCLAVLQSYVGPRTWLRFQGIGQSGGIGEIWRVWCPPVPKKKGKVLSV